MMIHQHYIEHLRIFKCLIRCMALHLSVALGVGWTSILSGTSDSLGS